MIGEKRLIRVVQRRVKCLKLFILFDSYYQNECNQRFNRSTWTHCSGAAKCPMVQYTVRCTASLPLDRSLELPTNIRLVKSIGPIRIHRTIVLGRKHHTRKPTLTKKYIGKLHSQEIITYFRIKFHNPKLIRTLRTHNPTPAQSDRKPRTQSNTQAKLYCSLMTLYPQPGKIDTMDRQTQPV